MTNSVAVGGDKTLGSGDDGVTQCVTVGSTITIPLDTTHKFLDTDEIPITSQTTGIISLALESTAITFNCKGTRLTSKFDHATLRKVSDNTWEAWGDLST